MLMIILYRFYRLCLQPTVSNNIRKSYLDKNEKFAYNSNETK